MSASTSAPGVPEVTQSPHRYVLYQHRICAQEDLKSTFAASYGALYAHIAASGVAPSGPPFAIYHESSEPEVRWEIDICAPVTAPMAPSADFEFMEMPAGKVVSMLHEGPYESLGHAYATVQAYISGHGLTVAGPPREIYLSEPDVHPSKVKTLLEFPVF